ncbi:zinc finger CCCH domain-containing protein 13-like isoform X1 [Triticum urartu]|uniref:C3H1-type domain-containing protein n=1 Tax=Triticum urartu TaxID=4572 RepID=A0A8R7R6U4_TRIUA|nr:zinc finger CCCH domain-containing protein 13-like isoform X1 [Triticum urartu]
MREMLDPPPRRGPAFKTKLCALWRRGPCPRGPSCGFAHGEGELRTPPPHSTFPPRAGPGGRDHRIHEFRGRPERRNSPRRRYSPDRDTRGHLFRNKMPPHSRGSSQSRSPIRKSDRRPKKKVDGDKSDSSGSFNTSENEDRKKDDIHSSSDEKDDGEAKLKQIALDMKALHEDKSKLQTILDKKIDEAGILSGRVDDLESQLNKEKEDCERMTSKIKKLIKAYGRYVKAQDDLKRSQGRFERLADSLASDSLKSGTKEQGSSVNAGNDDPYNAYEMSPDDQRQKNGSAARKRSAALSTSEEEKTGKKRRVNGDDMIHVSGKYRSEDALESLKNSKGTESLKKLGDDDNNDELNVISSGNDFTDRYNGNEEDDPVDL